MQTYRSTEVFVAGGMPTLTYVPRSKRKLEAKLRAVSDHLCKLVTVTGATKSGKTVLVSKVFDKTLSVWVDGGLIKQEDDLWNLILEAIGGYTATTQSSGRETSAAFSGELGLKGGLPP